VTPDEQPPPYQEAWGQTLDLASFEQAQERASGAAERVCGRINAGMLGGSKIPFEYLGRIQTTRGQRAATDEDFARSQEAFDPLGYGHIIERM
jgi:hypothetical protein